MANDSLGDRARTINLSSHFSSLSDELQSTVLDLRDHIEESLGKAKALSAVALMEGLEECSPSTQHLYISVLDDLIDAAMEDFQQLTSICFP